MVDPRFYRTNPPIDPVSAFRIAGAKPVDTADEAMPIVRVAAAGDVDLAGAAVFVEDERAASAFIARAQGTCPSFLIIPETLVERFQVSAGMLAVAANPRAAFARLAAALHEDLVETGDAGFRSGRDVAESFPDARIDPTARIGRGAAIASGAVIGPFAVIGPGVTLAGDVRIGAGAVVTHADVGDGARIAANAVVGGEGFGVVEMDGRPRRMPQLGVVRIGARVEIGAGTTVDRAALGATEIGDDAKIDNLVQVAHNVRIGRGCVIAAHCGIAGSARLGDGVVMGGHSGIADHVTIGAGARLGAKSGFMRDVPAGESWGGTPAMPTHLWWRSILFMQRASRPKAKRDNGD